LLKIVNPSAKGSKFVGVGKFGRTLVIDPIHLWFFLAGIALVRSISWFRSRFETMMACLEGKGLGAKKKEKAGDWI
jgi:hypothetical protein